MIEYNLSPLYIRIVIYFSIIIFIFYSFLGKDFSITNIYLLFFLFIFFLIFIILEKINKFIFFKKINLLPKKVKNKLLIDYKTNFFKKLYYLFFPYKNKYNKENNVKEIDHGFDGITEFDNKIPTWWKNIFYLTIIYSFIYFIAYIFFDYSDPKKEYIRSYKKHVKQIELYEKSKPKITIDNTYFKENYIKKGKILFNELCSICHKEDGSGDTGPNLTDDYWINIEKNNLYKNIFYIIWNGSKKNPIMRGFGKNGELKGKDIEKIASYVYSINIKKEKPDNVKFPQGKKVNWKKLSKKNENN
ncbi:cbb3-type cytochrome c oxidase N-terminal domain-containing protein [Candidatus Shikimatogenerans silvanidophilus]|uniref:cbb3-type cytochrome c oxidase N-terminal domain-containing protein n=1 Tax=Candidatus Shikimatogenerans silvanidophilus TaxID=2782547 RepID=UPI001BABB4E4|nr:cbb3-type cytochrome c oxidase N-terminal domain-containing protein [Candidatus Shikimatogenerans silvanidophilus]